MSLSLRSAIVAMSISIPPPLLELGIFTIVEELPLAEGGGELQRQRRTPLPKRLSSQRESHGSKVARSKIGKTRPRNGKKVTGKSRLRCW
jgi:hypothetical protein